MKFWNFYDKLDEKAKKQLSLGIIAAGFAVIFTLGVVTGKVISDKPVIFDAGMNNSVNVSYESTGSVSTGANQGSSSSAQDNQNSQSGSTGSDTGADTDSGADAGSSQKTTKEIIDLFNESANKVKTEATKVTKNFENRNHLEEHLVLPSVLEGMAKGLMEEAFKDDTEAIVYGTKDEIIAEYQVPGQSWVSQLTETEVAEASFTDNGTEYEIYIKLNPTVNPEPGNGVAKAFDTITSSEILEKAPPIVKEFTTEYFDCVIKCKIDKTTGRMTWASYDSPLILKLKVEFLGKLDAQVGMQFVKDYTIEY